MKKELKNKIIAALLGCSMVFGMASCDDEDWLDDEETTVQDKSESGDSSNSGDTSGSVIKRNKRKESKDMGEPNTWTIFVYLCGSDLESDGGAGTADMEEMMAASTNSNIKFVVQTGGASKWYNDASADEIDRFVITEGECEQVDSQKDANMAESATLTAFLKWGIKEYPAANMGLIFWNHGSGSINGVCFDEKNNNDSLFLKEIDASLFSVYDQMTENFEFIGFDACLMGNVEAAAMLASHANYMVGSEELEPGCGWNYEAIGKFLDKNPGADGAALGKEICDSFYEGCKDSGDYKESTLSVIDLKKIDNVITTFDAYAKDLNSMAKDKNSYADFARKVVSIENYGGNNKTEGYTNMVDLKALIEAGKSYSKNADAAQKAIDEAVVYKISGSVHKTSGGLSLYYPLQIQGSQELGIFKQVTISANYLALVDKVANGFVNSGSISDYSNDEIANTDTSNYSNSQYTQNSDGDYDYQYTQDNTWSSVDSHTSGESSAITFETKPYLDEEGTYSFVLDENGLANAASVQATLYMDEGDNEFICLGISSDVQADWESGSFTDNLDGKWFSLPDGQVLCIYLVSENDGYDVFTTPILLNGKETNLRFAWYYNDSSIEILGVWDGVEDNGCSARPDKVLKDGDKIVPLYDCINIETEEESQYEGDEYKYNSNDSITFSELPDGDYYYGFFIDDVYGDYYTSDLVSLTIDGDSIYFNEEE